MVDFGYFGFHASKYFLRKRKTPLLVGASSNTSNVVYIIEWI
jgi:hypothetical protein